jgi:hypothetical protein
MKLMRAATAPAPAAFSTRYDILQLIKFQRVRPPEAAGAAGN